MSTQDYGQELESLIDHLVSKGASDIHFSVGRAPTIRIVGELEPVANKDVLTIDDIEGFAHVLMRQDQYERFTQGGEVDFSFQNVSGHRFRGNMFYQQGKPGIVLRFIPGTISSIEELNLPPILYSFAQKRQGFFLCVGPVGQGKSTTLAAMVNDINQKRAEHIVTIEDPIEYVYTPKKSMVNQREVGFDSPTFESALNSAFRQDVNVILIGEMRNRETIATAVTAAETGHLVFSTLHTNNAAQTISRIIDTFPGNQQDQIRVQLSSSLLGIFSQRLVPRIDGGRIPAFELLVNNSAVANLIREDRIHEISTVIETGLEYGMLDMNRSLVDLVKRGIISVDTAFAYSIDPKSLERLI